jgi:hypothetical protein
MGFGSRVRPLLLRVGRLKTRIARRVAILAGGQVVWTDERTALRDWLIRNAPSLAELHEAAVLMLYAHNPLLPGRSRLVAHAVREVRNRLPDAVAGKTVAKQLQYQPRYTAPLAVFTVLRSSG